VLIDAQPEPALTVGEPGGDVQQTVAQGLWLRSSQTAPTAWRASRTPIVGASSAIAVSVTALICSWPATEASRAAVLARVLSAPFALGNPLSQQTRRLGVLAVLSWLTTFPGASWQQRW